MQCPSASGIILDLAEFGIFMAATVASRQGNFKDSAGGHRQNDTTRLSRNIFHNFPADSWTSSCNHPNLVSS